MVIGNMLRDREVQYSAVRDETTNTWRILDTWHDALRKLDPDDDIPDENDAVKILTEGEFISLMKEAARLGVLANATFGSGEAEYEATILERDQEIQRLHEELLVLQETTSQVVRDNTHTEEYVLQEKSIVSGQFLKEKAMDSIIKLVSLQDMTNLGRD
jgi:hypothetical protein